MAQILGGLITYIVIFTRVAVWFVPSDILDHLE